MFLNGLKAKSIVRKLKKEIELREYQPSHKTIRKVGILQDEKTIFDKKQLAVLAKSIGVAVTDIKIFTFVKTIPKDQSERADIFSDKQIGWKATLKTADLKAFKNTEFDMLINYYVDDHLPLKTLGVLSKAVFKIGMNKTHVLWNDLIIETTIGQESIFIEELKKYLQILKII